MMRRGIGRVGRPSLIGTAARTAVVAGTATAVAGKVGHSQQEKAQQAAEAEAAEQQQQQAAIDAGQAAAAGGRAAAGAPAAAGLSRRHHRPAAAARRAEEPGHAHRGRVRGPEGQDARHVTSAGTRSEEFPSTVPSICIRASSSRIPRPRWRWLREHDPVHRSALRLLAAHPLRRRRRRAPRPATVERMDEEGFAARCQRRATATRADPDDPFVRAQQVVLHSFNMKDPPSHTRIRQLVQQAFTRPPSTSSAGGCSNWSIACIDAGLAHGSLDLVTELAFPLTITVASEMIGIPADARDRFRASFEDTERLGDPTATDEQRAAGPRRAGVAAGLHRRRGRGARRTPQTDLVTRAGAGRGARRDAHRRRDPGRAAHPVHGRRAPPRSG